MKITDIISKSDLGEPYVRLSEFLELDELVKVEQTYGGRQIKFKRGCSDISGEYPELTSMLGMEKAARFINAIGDIWIYFPKLRRSAFDKIKASIINDFKGYNYHRLAQKYGYTERHIRRIVAGAERRHEMDENQVSLFDAFDDVSR
jgi:hypothetical protein